MPDEHNIEEVKDLRSTVKLQSLEMKEIYETISSQAEKLTECTPEVEILKNWIQFKTGMGRSEINEIIRIEMFFRGSIEKAIEFARKDFNRDYYFYDFIEGAKAVALSNLKTEIAEEQRVILQTLSFNAMTMQWGKVKEHSLINLILLPKDLQDLFAAYIYYGTEELEKRLIEQARIAYSVYLATLKT